MLWFFYVIAAGISSGLVANSWTFCFVMLSLLMSKSKIEQILGDLVLRFPLVIILIYNMRSPAHHR